jgi:hypothetical protein
MFDKRVPSAVVTNSRDLLGGDKLSVKSQRLFKKKIPRDWGK